LEGKTDCATAWNFGPNDAEALSVKEVIKYIKKFWDDFEYTTTESSQHEAMLLRLDCTQAKVKLNWQPVWGSSQTFEYTTKWYKTYYESGHIATAENLLRYISDAKKKGLPWVK
jgi:CDP-glucose 4,6-dehydratase